MQRHLARALFLAVMATVAAPTAQAQLLPVSIELGDVSLTKLPFVMAAEAGIYRRNGLETKQYITPRAAELMRKSPNSPNPWCRAAGGPGCPNRSASRSTSIT